MTVSRCTRRLVRLSALLSACVLPPAALAQNAQTPNYRAADNRAANSAANQPAALPARSAPNPRLPAPYGGPAVRRPVLPNSSAGRVVPIQFEESVEGVPAGAPIGPVVAPQAGPMGPMQVRDATTYPPMQASPKAGERPPVRVAEAASLPSGAAGTSILEPIPGEHPLGPAIRWAKQGMEYLNKVEDYQCTMVKRERIDGELGEHEYMFVKVRHKPFSVYTYFLAPGRVKGREALYVEGKNNGKMHAHGNGVQHRLFGTVSLQPTAPLAMSGNRYPITEMGIRRLTERLIEIGSDDMQFGECDVNWIQGAKINNRACTCIQVTHPIPRKNFKFNLARIYVDDELQLPTRYEAYDWPRDQGGQPLLTEEYTFLNVKVNNHFTDEDFDTNNPNYAFK